MRIHLQALLNRDVVKNTGRVKKKTAHRYGKGKTQAQSSDQMESIGGEHNPVAKQREIIQMQDNSPGRGKHPNDKSKSPNDKVK